MFHMFKQCRVVVGFSKDFNTLLAMQLQRSRVYVSPGRPETDQIRQLAMNLLGNGLFQTDPEGALSVEEANVSMLRRIGAREGAVLAVQGNLASTYQALGRREEALDIFRDVRSGNLRLAGGEENRVTLVAAFNCVLVLMLLRRSKEVKSLLHNAMPAARRVLGENNEITLRMRQIYAVELFMDADATLENVREAVTRLEETERTTRRVFGSAHPTTALMVDSLQEARAALRAREE